MISILLAASLLFSFLHVATMVGLREALWWGRGYDYSFDFAGDWLYEYRKDAVGFALALLFLNVAQRLPRPAQADRADVQDERPLIRLADGSRQVEVNPRELRALRAAGNYAELIFADGRSILIRTTLAAAGAALAAHGFRRTHKSWLVRLAAVTGLKPTRAGDFRLRLGADLEAPLSRHNRAVVEEVRARLCAVQTATPPGSAAHRAAA